MKAISVRQPFAWAIVFAGKNIENRCWSTRYRGEILIHAPNTLHACREKSFTDYYGVVHPSLKELKRGGIIGIAEVVDCVMEHDSKWFTGEYGIVVENARPLPFHRCRGRLGVFDVDYPYQIDGV